MPGAAQHYPCQVHLSAMTGNAGSNQKSGEERLIACCLRKTRFCVSLNICMQAMKILYIEEMMNEKKRRMMSNNTIFLHFLWIFL